MLKELRIENFAIIPQLELRFQPGLSTFTGETGAGKSIVLDAIEMLAGGKTDVSMVRSGTERAVVEGEFSVPPVCQPLMNALLEPEGLLDDPAMLTLSREIRAEGRSTARVNGRAVAATLLKELGLILVDIHGQSEHLSLLNVRQHLGLLDRFAADEDLLAAYQTPYRALRSVLRELADLRQAEKDAARQTDLLNYQIQEIESAHLRQGEEDELRAELNRLANAEKLATLTRQAFALIEESETEAPTVADLLGQAAAALRALAAIDDSLQPLLEQGESLSAVSADLGASLRDYLAAIEFNPRRLEQVEERLGLIASLRKKYGVDEAAVLAFGQQARAQLEKITHAGEKLLELETLQTQLEQELAGHALALSQARGAAAAEMSIQVEGELSALRMAGAHFSVDARRVPDEKGLPVQDETRVKFDEHGIDQVEFLIAPNPGEGLKPLVKIASGGETSRLMLALKNVLARADTVPTLIFDEIDQGIGGRVGSLVGEKLWCLAREHQVFCVTHLPQLAAFGDQHYRVRKSLAGERTMTEVIKLDAGTQIEELALMLGGTSDANRAAAREAVDTANQRKALL